MDLPFSTERRRIRQALVKWFRRSCRRLPWRENRDPYRIWVSEIMLQQTQVATVVPFFERFVRAFPMLADLAAAGLHDVHRLWEGLGYYRRADNLHRAARRVVAEHGGRIPEEPAVLRKLPGIGRYTANAILSQAFDSRLPILEANSQRVLCRLLGQEADPRSGPVRRGLWEAAETLLPARGVGEFNQALMELGALVCTASAPRCAECPLGEWCVARRLGLQSGIPLRTEPPGPVAVREVGVVVRRGGRVLLAQRPDEGRWAGLWEFPHIPLKAGEVHEEAATRLIAELTGVEAEIGAELATLRHSVTHHRITLVCFEATYVSGKFRSTFYRRGRWLAPSRLAAYPVSAPQRRLARMLLAPVRQGRLF